MTTRLLALVLGLIIGSPACWCCESSVVASDTSQKTEECCHHTSTQTDQSPAGSTEKCPCTSNVAKRDLGSVNVATPAGAVSYATLPPWDMADSLLAAPMTVLPYTGRGDESPPGVVSALYLQHCALLL